MKNEVLLLLQAEMSDIVYKMWRNPDYTEEQMTEDLLREMLRVYDWGMDYEWDNPRPKPTAGAVKARWSLIRNRFIEVT